MQLSLPPHKERRTKTKSQARLDRVDQVNISFDREPGIQNMRADEPEIGQRADNSQRRLRKVRPAGNQQIRGRNSDQHVSGGFGRWAEKQHPHNGQRHGAQEKSRPWPMPNSSQKANCSGESSYALQQYDDWLAN